jgi:surface protein
MERITFIQDMKGLFMGMESFNSELNRWDTSQATSMASMFSGSLFNQNINMWDTSQTTSMASMFSSGPFNQDINGWETSK